MSEPPATTRDDSKGGNISTSGESVVSASKERYEGDSVTLAVGIYWILPLICIAILSRFAVDTEQILLPTKKGGGRQITLNFDKDDTDTNPHRPSPPPTIVDLPTPTSRPGKGSLANPGYLANKPTSYQETIKAISRRRLDWSSANTRPHPGYAGQSATGSTRTATTSSSSSSNDAASPSRVSTSSSKSSQASAANPSKPSSSSPPPRGASQDPARMQLYQLIENFRGVYQSNTSDLYNAVRFGDALRMYDVQYHDGGSMQAEAIQTYQNALTLAWTKRQEIIDAGEPTNRALTGIADVNEEIIMEYSARSIDGILCSIYTSLGKTYFMANMFGKAVESYSEALKLEPLYLDAMSARGSSLIILGEYEKAAQDFLMVIQNDDHRRFLDVFTGLARVLSAREDAVPGGWDSMIVTLQQLIPVLEGQIDSITNEEGRAMVGSSLNRLYHVLFNYHDVKTKDTDAAWESLSKAYHFKMSNLPPWNTGFETQKIQVTKQIFHAGFWPSVGSQSETPIFIIGFVRSGSTLLERILDAHPDIVGTGENSVFNGQLDEIRNKIVQASMLNDPEALAHEIEVLAEGVVNEMKNRWDMVASGEERAAGRRKPRKFVDKMLTNYYNVGFIHMLFPKALILHVVREPMDTLFSAYKHEFPAGALDYTSAFDSLAEMYLGYREVMEHWDSVLPGRVMTIRYEEMVEDMPRVARGIIDATGLEWNDEILNFHKKKQAVNTLSTTQVRKGIYKDSLQSWRRYEEQLQPLVKLIGNKVRY